jgi:hypothetical protein
LKTSAAAIHPRLRVRILPLDSNVESSNMASLPSELDAARRLGGESFPAHGRLHRPARHRATSLDQGTAPPLRRTAAAGDSGLSFIPFGTTVLV